MEKEITPEQTPEMKVCKKCGRELPVTEFNKHGKTKDGLQPYCRECQSEMAKARAKNKAEAPTEAIGIDDETLVAELRRRGYEVKCTKTIIVEL